MRILHAIPSVDPAMGGPVQGMFARVPLLHEMGHEIEVVSLDRGDEPFFEGLPVPVHGVGDGKGGFGYTPRLVPWVRENHGRFDRVVINGIWQYHSTGTAQALEGTNRPYYVFTHGMLDPWFRRYPLKHIKKQVFWLLKEHRVLNRAEAVLFTCEEERVLARNAFFPYRIKERVVNYGTKRPEKEPEVYRQAFQTAFPELQGKRFVLYLSRIHVKKGIDLLVRAFSVLHEKLPFDLVVAGPDQTGLGKKLQEECERLGIASRVSWLGMVKGDAKYGAFQCAEASILPSHQENFGISVAESLACGTPVLISNKVNIWREIHEEGAGFVQNDDLEGTIKLLLDWAETPAEKRSEMSRRAVSCFNEKFEIRNSVLSYLEALA